MDCFFQDRVGDGEKRQVRGLCHVELPGKKLHSLLAQTGHSHVDGTHLKEVKYVFFSTGCLPPYLSVKRIHLQLIDTLKLVSVALN